MKALIAIVLPVLIAASAAAAQSGSYSGNWPVKAKLPPQYGNTGCLTLTDNGTDGSPHSGPVTSSGDLTGGLSGTFQVVKGLLVVNLQGGSGNGEVYYLSFIAPAHDGKITGKGVFNDPGVFPVAVAPLTFGENGGC
ncbi:MAG TPA: hypothetical protein VHX61_18825 [Rhizomicrobium sp.]|jgi:hypothetical protein|nr:hypothetical protein [Rhizomicrobium sp.]